MKEIDKAIAVAKAATGQNEFDVNFSYRFCAESGFVDRKCHDLKTKLRD